MSNDNIYNILGRLDALTAKQEPAAVEKKSINESVEARGSVLEGVSRVEARLARMFEQGMDEGVPSADMQIDPRSTAKYAEEIVDKLNSSFGTTSTYGFSTKYNQDGSVTIVQSHPGTMDPQHADMKGVVSPQNVSKLIDPYYNMFRQKSWRFDQPAGGQFTIAVPVQQDMAEAAAPIDFDKVLEAIAALYGDDMWENDAMQDLAHDLEQAGPTDQELDFIIAKGRLPKRLKNTQFSAGDSVQFREESDWSNLGAEYRSTKPGTKEPTHTGEKEYFKGGVKHTKDYNREVSHTAATGEKRGRGRPKKSQFEEGQQVNELSPELMQRAAGKAGAMVNKSYQDRNYNATTDYANQQDRIQHGMDKRAGKSSTFTRSNDYLKNEPGANTAKGSRMPVGMEEEQVDEISDQLAYNVNQARAGQHFAAQDKAAGAKQAYDRDGGMKNAQFANDTAQTARDARSKLSQNTALQKSRGQRLGKQVYEPATNQSRSSPQSMGTADGGLTRMKAPAQQMNHNYEESIEGRLKESINFAEMMKEQHQTIDEYLMELQADIAEFKKSGHMSDKLRDSMEMHKFSKKQVTDEVKGPSFAPQFPATPAPAKPPGMMQRAGSAIAGGVKAAAGAVNRAVGHGSDADMLNDLKRKTMDEELNELARLAGLSESLTKKQKDNIDKNKNGKIDSDDFKRLRDKVSEATVDEDYLKDKKADKDYDGDGEVETGSEEHAGSVDKAIKKSQAEKDSVKEAKKPDANKNGIPDYAEDGKGKNDLKKKKVDECGPEMSPFSSVGHEEETGMSINSSMDTKTGRRTLSVTADGEAAEQLAQMLKMAGLGGGHQHSHEEPEAVIIQAEPEEQVEEEREGQYANTPDEEVENIDTIMHQGNDLNREKEQYSTDRGRDNPMAMHREGIEMPRSLSRMLEAIKMVEDGKCNHSAKGKKCPVHGMDECSGMYETSTINGKVQDPKSLRWKQTSMSYEEAVKKYGKDKVRKDSKDRAGDEIVKVHVPLGEGKPSAGMTKGEKSAVVKKAKAGGDIGKPGKSFDKVAKAAGGGEKGKKIAAAAMWKNAAK